MSGEESPRVAATPHASLRLDRMLAHDLTRVALAWDLNDPPAFQELRSTPISAPKSVRSPWFISSSRTCCTSCASLPVSTAHRLLGKHGHCQFLPKRAKSSGRFCRSENRN